MKNNENNHTYRSHIRREKATSNFYSTNRENFFKKV